MPVASTTLVPRKSVPTFPTLIRAADHAQIYSHRFTTVVFDLGDVLVTWSLSSPGSPSPPETLKYILRSATWFEYEKGHLAEEEAYALVAQEFNIPLTHVRDTFQAVRDSLKINSRVLDLIRELRDSGRTIYAMSNISAPDWDVLSTKGVPEDWALFDRIFTSADAHERKPNMGFYDHVIRESGLDPSRTIFIDDKVENVLTARSFGLHGIVFDDIDNVVRQLRNACGDPAARGKSFLQTKRKQLLSVTSNGLVLSENFAQLLILEATGDNSLVDYVKHPGQFNFFQGGGIPTATQFPNDLDTTSIGLTVSDHIDSATKHRVMDQMLEYRNDDGIVQVYFDHSRPRLDPIVCVNVLTLFYQNERGHELGSTLDWVEKILYHRAYTSGTLYYFCSEQFFFFLSRLLRVSAEVRKRLGPLFKERLLERFGHEGDSLALAMRIISAATVEMIDQPDLEKLLSLQNENGSWTNGWFYKYGASGLLIGNDGVTTALAIQAIEETEKLRVANSFTTMRRT